MSEWSYSEEELDEYFRDPSARKNAEPGDGPDGRGAEEAVTGGKEGFFYRYFQDPQKAQAATALSGLVGLMLVGGLLGGLYLWFLTGTIPSTERLENPSVQLATIAYTADGKELARYATQNRSWVPYDSISSHTVNALLATEDRRFYQHWGVDPVGIASAMFDIITFRDFRGASTITQQLARNLYNEEVGRAVTIERKLKEMVTAVELERRYTKKEIIEMYLNTVSFGSNAFGIEAAARTYFGVSAQELSELQSATLIGLLQATSYYNPVRNPGNAQRRRNVVLRLMVDQGYLDRSFYEAHREDPVEATYHSARIHASRAPYFAEHVRNQLARWARDPDHPLYERDVYGDGLRVYTTLDSELQRLARQVVDENMELFQTAVGYEWSERSRTVYSQTLEDYADLEPGEDYEPFEYYWRSRQDSTVEKFIQGTDRYNALRDRGLSKDAALARLRENSSFIDSLRARKTTLETGFVSMDPRSGFVKVWIGGRNFRNNKYDKVSLARRQPGSTFKPFTYAAAIDNGWSPYDTLLDSTFTWKDPVTDSTWTPRNYNQQSSGQMLTLSQGLANSKNTITARLALDLNPETVVRYAHRMGIRSPLADVPSIALGTSGVTLLEMTSAYSTLANGGLYNEPVTVTRVEDRYGNVLWEASPTPSEVLSERSAYTVVDMMRGVIDYGTGVRIRTQFDLGEYDLAGKTGTTQRSADTWFMLMHPNLVSGAWMGFDDSRVTFRTDWWGQGAHSALFLVGDFYQRITESDTVSLPEAPFPMVEAFGPPESDSTGADQGGRLGW